MRAAGDSCGGTNGHPAEGLLQWQVLEAHSMQHTRALTGSPNPRGQSAPCAHKLALLLLALHSHCTHPVVTSNSTCHTSPAVHSMRLACFTSQLPNASPEPTIASSWPKLHL
jgi:hypothetical protein